MSDAAPSGFVVLATLMHREILVESRTRSPLASMGLFEFLEGDLPE